MSCGSMGRMLQVSIPLSRNVNYCSWLGNCGEEAGNGSFEKGSLSYSQ